ncbi:MAG: pyrroline-5-carboxylate reductase [Microthrixaceae bacterium]
MVELQFIGGGRMAGALLAGLLDTGEWSPGDIHVVEVSAQRREELAGLHRGVGLGEAPVPCDGLVMATKPAVVPTALSAAVAVGARRVLSIAAGVPLAALEAAVAEGAGDHSGIAVVRAMPNTPALVGEGASAICVGETGGDDDLGWARGLLGAVGLVEEVPESLMDAVTGLSGSGPAYLFLVAEAMTEAGRRNGLPADVAERLTNQTLLGASTLLARDERTAEQLRVMVTSPGGTTEAALAVLGDLGVPEAIIAAVTEAARRSAEMAPPGEMAPPA